MNSLRLESAPRIRASSPRARRALIQAFYFAGVDPVICDELDSGLAPFWRLWHYDFSTETSRQLTTLPEWTGHAHYSRLGDEYVFVYWEETATGNRTTFYRAEGGREPSRLFSYKASFYSYVKLR